LQAAEAKKQEVLLQNPKAKIHQIDFMIDWVRWPVGPEAVRQWDKAQREGNIKKLERILNMQWLADILFWPQVLFRAFRFLKLHNITRVIDTQPVCTGAIIKAIRAYNRQTKKNISLEKVVVDLPTDLNTHYFKPIKKLSQKDKKYLKIFTVDPLLKEGESEKDFWIRNCKIDLSQIVYQKYFIRAAFLQYQNKKPALQSMLLQTGFHHELELEMTKNILANREIEVDISQTSIDYVLYLEDRVHTILLGSQPAHGATINYLEGFVRLALKMKERKSMHYVFVFCSKHNQNSKSLFKAVYDFSVKHKDFAKNLIIIPLSFQREEVVASMFYRSTSTFTRSGGQTLMELLGVTSADIFIHSEAKDFSNQKQLMKGMFAWEGGSAEYMKKKRGAKIVTPHTFEPYMEKHFNC